MTGNEQQANSSDPLGFMRNLWGNMGFSLPGMVAPTLNVDDLDKQIKDMKAVEGWLRMNLSMLQMTIQNMEMQKTTVSAVKTMSQFAANAIKPMTGEDSAKEEPADMPPVMFPWQMMQQMSDHIQQNAAAVTAASTQVAAAVTPMNTAKTPEKTSAKKKNEAP